MYTDILKKDICQKEKNNFAAGTSKNHCAAVMTIGILDPWCNVIMHSSPTGVVTVIGLGFYNALRENFNTNRRYINKDELN